VAIYSLFRMKSRVNLSGGSLQSGMALELHAGLVWSSSRQYRFHAYASSEAGSDFKPSSKDWIPGHAVPADIRE